MPQIQEFTFDTPDRLSQLSDDDYQPGITNSPVYSNVNDAVSDIIKEQEQEQERETEMSAVEIRLEEANCYKALLSNPLFDNAGEIAQRVEAEVRNFVKMRLKVLLGLLVEEKKVERTFTEPEVVALKKLASRVLGTRQDGPPALAPRPEVNQAVTPVPNLVTKPAIYKQPSHPVAETTAPKPLPTRTPGPGVQQKDKQEPKSKKRTITKTVTMPSGEQKEIEINLTGQSGAKPRTLENLQEIADAAAAKATRESQGMAGLAQSGMIDTLMKLV